MFKDLLNTDKMSAMKTDGSITLAKKGNFSIVHDPEEDETLLHEGTAMAPSTSGKYAKLAQVEDGVEMQATQPSSSQMMNFLTTHSPSVIAKRKSSVPRRIIETDPRGLPKVGCMPNCSKGCMITNSCNFDYDYSKNYMDPEAERPGEFQGIDWNNVNASMGKTGICGWGSKQTPINLQTNIEINKDFKDRDFRFDYAEIVPYTQTIYKQKAMQYQIVLDGDKNYFQTSTVNLFDKHIESANLWGMQAHFHAPSEHSIDGKLLDLEMHVVHALDAKWNPGQESPADGKSQFSNGVLGFLFKAVPDNYFEQNGVDDYHDKFLKSMIEEQRQQEKPADNGSTAHTSRMSKKETFKQLVQCLIGMTQGVEVQQEVKAPEHVPKKLNMNKFVRKLNFNRRWTYQGSLTTTPFAEGILWNVIEQVIPIRQSTLDLFLEYRKIVSEIVVDKYSSEGEKNRMVACNHVPHNCKPFEDENGDTFFRFALCNRAVQDQNDRTIHHIDMTE